MVLSMVALIVIVGGITRLTESGLSMVDWRLLGTKPPTTQAEWMSVFEAYQQSPQYQKINSGMSLASFKSIFFWEYIHRMLGRLIGLACVGPFLFFLAMKKLNRRLIQRGILLCSLVGLQGLMGWYMVQSGLVNIPRVSHFRLAAHMGLAFTIFGLVLWTLLDQFTEKRNSSSTTIVTIVRSLSALIGIQLLLGAFTAGLRGGYGYNTWPKMGQHWMAPRKISI